MAIFQLKNHNFKDKDTFFASTLRDDKKSALTYNIYGLEAEKWPFFGEKWPFLIFYPPHSPQCIGMRTISPNFFWDLSFFVMLDHDILAHCASYKFMNKGDFNFFQWEISINR